jgi:arylsulfate sulfotransferase
MFQMRRWCTVILMGCFLSAGCSLGTAVPEDDSATGDKTGKPDIHIPTDIGDFEWRVADLSADTAAGIELSDVLIVQNPSNAFAFFVEWETDLEAVCDLRIVCGEDIDTFLSGDTEATEHQAYVMGLYAGAECLLTFTAVASGGETGSAVASLSVGPVPDFLPQLTIDVLDYERIERGWTLFNLTNSFDKPPLIIAIVDEQGRYRWYHQRATNDPGSDTDTRTTKGGVLVGGSHGQVLPAMIDWEGNVVWEKKVNMHHDMRPYGDDGHLFYLIDSWSCGLDHSTGAVVEYDPETDQEIWQWNICEQYLPDNPKPDWSHLNAAAMPADQSYMIVSSRNQNALFKVTLPAGNLVWKLAEDGDFAIDDSDVFYQQHDPEVQPDGSILLFDNGQDGKRKYSRALQLKVDETNLTATRIWEYRLEPDVFAPIWGDADRLPNGNTLIVFGQRNKSKETHIIEVTMEKEQVWHLVMPLKWGAYRAERITEPVYGSIK